MTHSKTIIDKFPTLGEIKEDISESSTPDKNKISAKDINEMREVLVDLADKESTGEIGETIELFRGELIFGNSIVLSETMNNFSLIEFIFSSPNTQTSSFIISSKAYNNDNNWKIELNSTKTNDLGEISSYTAGITIEDTDLIYKYITNYPNSDDGIILIAVVGITRIN